MVKQNIIHLQITFKLGTVSVLDSPDLDLQCSFVARGKREATVARMIGDRITCPLPLRSRLQSIPAEQGEIVFAFYMTVEKKKKIF